MSVTRYQQAPEVMKMKIAELAFQRFWFPDST